MEAPIKPDDFENKSGPIIYYGALIGQTLELDRGVSYIINGIVELNDGERLSLRCAGDKGNREIVINKRGVYIDDDGKVSIYPPK